MLTPVWSDNNRFNQTGYSGKTIFPIESNYKDKSLYEEDYTLAYHREESHADWLLEQEEEYRQQWLEYCEEIKKSRGGDFS